MACRRGAVGLSAASDTINQCCLGPVFRQYTGENLSFGPLSPSDLQACDFLDERLLSALPEFFRDPL